MNFFINNAIDNTFIFEEHDGMKKYLNYFLFTVIVNSRWNNNYCPRNMDDKEQKKSQRSWIIIQKNWQKYLAGPQCHTAPEKKMVIYFFHYKYVVVIPVRRLYWIYGLERNAAVWDY